MVVAFPFLCPSVFIPSVILQSGPVFILSLSSMLEARREMNVETLVGLPERPQGAALDQNLKPSPLSVKGA